jgi:hypothetical protein
LIVGEMSMKRSETLPFMKNVTSPQLRRWLPHRIRGGKHVINIREASTDESESDTWTSQGSMGPQGTQTASKHAMHQESTLGPIGQPPRGNTLRVIGLEDRLILGSAEPPLVPLILAFHVVSHDWSLGADRSGPRYPKTY